MLDRDIPHSHIRHMMTLQEYLKGNGIRQADFGSRIGATQGTVSRWCTGRKLPDMVTAARIERETDGAVPLGIWVKIEDQMTSNDHDKQTGAAA